MALRTETRYSFGRYWMEVNYRRDIDWLRAFAVLSVIGFHFEFTGFRGGFVGVDVFFVISGFLIGRMVMADLAAGTFSFSRFYERRIRRLVPALYVMLIATSFIGGFILFGAERAEFLRSIVFVATFTSNVLFWTQSGYFDRASSEKPLLHTWSLGIEEQFYIFLPILLLLAWRLGAHRAARLFVLTIALASFLVSYSLVSSDRAGAFFLIQSRAWELLLGVLLVWIPTPRSPWTGHAARSIGLTMIIIAILSYPSGIAFPGVNALLPCMGAALFISGGTLSLRAPPIEWIGRMSYSLYLWHWPIYTFAKMRTLSMVLAPSEKILLIVALISVSYASYRFIELPARTILASSRRVFAYTASATAAGILLAIIGASTSFTETFDSKVATLKSYERLTGMERERSCFAEDWTSTNHPECFMQETSKPAILLWGDSLADHYMPGMESAISRAKLLQANAAGCFPTFFHPVKQYGFCDKLATRVRAFVQTSSPSLVIISADWVGYSQRMGLGPMIADLKSTVAAIGVPVVLIGPSIQFKGRLPAMLLRAAMRNIEPLSANEFMIEGLFDLDENMKAALSSTPNLSYVSSLAVTCPAGVCPLIVDNGAPITWDHGHLTAEGSRYVIRGLAPAIFGRYANAGAR